MSEARDNMIIHHPDRLHVGIANRGTNELEPTLFEGSAHLIGLFGFCWDFFSVFPKILDGLLMNEGPKELPKRPDFIDYREIASSVLPGG